MISAKDLVHHDRHDHLYSKIPNIDESKLAGREREGKKNPWFSNQIDGDDVEKMIPQGENH